jgi:anthranilate phosphoribosyltransferase
MTEVMEGDASPIQIGALLAGLRTKGESVDELVGFARVMREHSIKVEPRAHPILDMCGTGGDTCNTFNISTAATFVVAAAGIPVAKHGNRAVSSLCGSADVLAAVGVELDLTPQQIASCIDSVGVGFMYAPSHHPATKNAAGPRKELGIRTTFNLVGPLTNPAGATHQLVGVFHPDLCPVVAEALLELGCERAMVVHGMDGMDELSSVGPTRISILQHGRVHTETRIPSELFMLPTRIEEIAGGGSIEENAEILLAVLKGEKGPRRDIVCLNAAAGLILGGMAESWRDGLSLAHRVIDNGKAATVLNNLIEFTGRFSQVA